MPNQAHQHILVPIDFSHHATLALEEAADLAHKYQADLTVVYVIPQVVFHPEWSASIEDTMEISDITEEAQAALTDMIAPYRQDGLAITEHILAGGPYIEIVRLAERIGADLIVMGAHGAAGAQPVLMGSVAEKVMRQAPCSVLTVREPVASVA
ncbi:universal stress protein [Candidatus Entotheonella palauensis]|uniref:universal stress protein n=1 Tax=Candidatus Entotheonella palauensis TaxID=93172 RepID=UPI0015C4826A|nr:universal stress protein [Candidatus Entotheonella palauensis]